MLRNGTCMTINLLIYLFIYLMRAYGHFFDLLSCVIAPDISLCNRYLLCFRHIFSEHNYVSGDILIKMLIFMSNVKVHN